MLQVLVTVHICVYMSSIRKEREGERERERARERERESAIVKLKKQLWPDEFLMMQDLAWVGRMYVDGVSRLLTKDTLYKHLTPKPKTHKRNRPHTPNLRKPDEP